MANATDATKEKAKELGLTFQSNISEKTLAKRVEDALIEQSDSPLAVPKPMNSKKDPKDEVVFQAVTTKKGVVKVSDTVTIIRN
jgi:hypothetical protein